MDAEVAPPPSAGGEAHRLWLADGESLTLRLHLWNHAPRELPRAGFTALWVWYEGHLRKQHLSSTRICGTPSPHSGRCDDVGGLKRCCVV